MAWIETSSGRLSGAYVSVSPPARVAWIETLSDSGAVVRLPVATREGGVDRNINQKIVWGDNMRRHPRGWRG